MRKRLRRRAPRDPAELNITAFLNLMVVLVPFLLITAVFSRITILEMNLPAPNSAQSQPEPRALQLEVIVRGDGIEVGDRRHGLIRWVSKTAGGDYDLAGLTTLLQDIKVRYPDTVDAAILLEPDIDYDVIVQVMDTVRLVPIERDGTRVHAELFPEISFGDAPPAPVSLQAQR